MSSGLLPPLPDLIPIAALRRNCAIASSEKNINNNSGHRDSNCSRPPPSPQSEVMGEQRSRRTAKQPATVAVDLPIDNSSSTTSRGASAAPQTTPQSRKTRSERHRKSDRRRDHHQHRKPVATAAKTRSDSKQKSSSRSKSRESTSPERPRVNPIFVWVRQEDTLIVDVKCEDYDKRNRILLTKTAQGWRAIPRTETLVPSAKEPVEKHQHHHRRKSKKNKIRRKSAAVQVESDIGEAPNDDERDFEEDRSASPSWMTTNDVESILPSHTIVNSKRSPTPVQQIKEEDSSGACPETVAAQRILSVNNTAVTATLSESAAQSPLKCSADKICDVSPLDNLLAVAELEFNQQIRSGEWNKTSTTTNQLSEMEELEEEDNVDEQCNEHVDAHNENELELIDTSVDDAKDFNNTKDEQKEDFMPSADMDQLNQLLNSCSNNESNLNIDLHIHNNLKETINNEFDNNESKSEDCDYNDDDDNNIGMDDILSRLEQSLRSPESGGDISNSSNKDACKMEEENTLAIVDKNMEIIEENETQPSLQENELIESDIPNEIDYKIVPEELEHSFFDDTPSAEKESEPKDTIDLTQSDEKELETEEPSSVVESSTIDEEPTDLSIKSKHLSPTHSIQTTMNNACDEIADEPTDLSCPKLAKSPIRPLVLTNISRPPSQNSEAIQSPQPSGIPAVPPSPDIVSTSANLSKNKTVFLESLLTTVPAKKIDSIENDRQKEPLDLGKCRKSASPTITCSQEINSIPTIDLDAPPAKKFKSESNLAIKNLLDTEKSKENDNEKIEEKIPETPRLLELLKTDAEPDPLTQLRQLLADQVLNVPDPMLVPKEKLSLIISHPGKEIPKLLKQRPELRLPEALAFPHLLQDPDILVITLQQLETIILKQGPSMLKDVNALPTGPKSSAEKLSEKKINKKLDKPTETTVSALKDVATSANKKKNFENPLKPNTNANPVHDPGPTKSGINELASEIDAATAAAFNQMMWLPYLNHLEAMSMGNSGGSNSDMLKLLSSTLPLYPVANQIPDLSHLFAANNARFPSSSVGFPLPPPPLNYNNPLEMSMWQEAMLQANMLRPKNPFESIAMNKHHQFRDYLDKITPSANNNNANSNKKSMSSSSKSHAYHQSSHQSNSGNGLPFANPFLNLPNYSGFGGALNGSKQNLQIPPFSSNVFPQPKNSASQSKTNLQKYQHQQKHVSEKISFPSYFNDDKLNRDLLSLHRDGILKDHYRDGQNVRESHQQHRDRDSHRDARESHRDARENHRDLRETHRDLRETHRDLRETHRDFRDTYRESRESQRELREIQKDSRDIHKETQYKDQLHRPKLMCKSFANIANVNHQSKFLQDCSTNLAATSGLTSKDKLDYSINSYQQHHSSSYHRPTPTLATTTTTSSQQSSSHQPIDLSGSTTPTTGLKLKVKQQLIDPANGATATKLVKHDDIPEVGSTTASIEEMQDAHKHLWHPLFGNQKGYTSPWNWTTVTATGE